MQGAKLKLIHAFGSTCSRTYKNAISICDEDKNEPKIVFPVGKALARKYVDRQQMDFIQFSDSTQEIQCISVLPNRSHVAVAQKSINSNVQQIRIYSFNKDEEPHTIKIFHESDKIGIIKLIVFSASEPKFMCSMIDQPHNKLIFVDTSKNKSLAESTFALKDVEQISINPFNSHLICASGGQSIRLFKVEEYAFKPLQEIRKLPRGRIYTAHCWYKRKMLIAATDKRQILIFEQVKPNVYQLKQEYENIFSQGQGEKAELITAICPFSKGLIMGSSNGKFCLWTRKQDVKTLEGSEKLELARKWSTTAERACAVRSIAMSVKEDLLVVSMANNDIASLYLSEIMPQLSDLLMVTEAESEDREVLFEYLYKGFHNAAITGMDICLQRPLVATCSTLDSTIRLWNYRNFGCKLLRMFYFKIKTEGQGEIEQPLLTLGLHPSGYYMAVGCTDRLRFFHVLNSEMRPYREIGVRKVHILKFSEGGHLLAVGHPVREETAAQHVRVYNALTLEELVVFRDHLSAIKSLQWKSHDECLLSVSEEAMLLEWRVSDWSINKKVAVQKSPNGSSSYNLEQSLIVYQNAVYNHTRNSILVYGRQGHKNFLEEHTNQSSERLEIDMAVTSMLEIHGSKEISYLVLALDNGSLVVFGGMGNPRIMNHQNHHIGHATQLILSPCGRYVITAGTDCLIYVYEVSFLTSEEQNYEQPLSVVVDDFLADVVLINKQEILKYTQKEKEYTKVIGSLSKKLKILSEQSVKKHNHRLSELQMQKNRIIEDVSYRIEKLNEQVEILKSKNDTALEDLDSKNMSQINLLEKNYEDKIKFQAQKYFQLEQELIQLKILHQKKLQTMHKQEEQNIKKLKGEFQLKFKDSQSIFSDTKRQTSEAENIFQQRLKQIQEQQEEQLRQIQAKKQKYKLQTAAGLQELHQKLQKLKTQHLSLSNRKNQAKAENDGLVFNRRKVQKQVVQLNQKMKDLMADYQEKFEILTTKQAKIVEFEEKINDLQKKKHILSYKATEMRKAIEPKQYQIQKLKLDLIKLKKQFQLSLERKQKANLRLQKLNKEKQYVQKCLSQQIDSTNKEAALVDQIVGDIYNSIDMHSNGTDVKVYYKQLIKLYHKYVEKHQKGNSNQSKGAEQITKHIVHLENSLFQMNKSNEKNILRKIDEASKRTKENTELVNNLNEIKKQNKELALKIRSKNLEIQNLRNLKSNLLENCPKLDAVTLKLMSTQENKVDYSKKTPIKRLSSINGRSQTNFHSSAVKGPERTLANNPSLLNSNMKMAPKKSLPNNPNYNKRQCQIVSQIEFISEKMHKYEFYVKDMMERLKKHCFNARCLVDDIIDIKGQFGESDY